MDFIDLKSQQLYIREKIEKNINTVINHGQYIMGPEVQLLEKSLATYTVCKHAIACASGTDALLMALMAYGVGPGDAILTTPFTFIATAEVISLLGATPVFVDIDPKTFNIDPAMLDQAICALKKNDYKNYPLPKITGAVTPKGIIPVDLFGLLAKYPEIEEVAKKHNLFIIEDAAQSFGAEYHDRKACSFGNIACTSFFPAKPLGCYGDGGMCFTMDDKLADLMRSVRIHGKGDDKYDNVRIGINGRLDTIQAAILLAKFGIFPEEIEMRQKAAGYYSDNMSANPMLTVPHVPKGYKSAWAQYSILCKDESHRALLMDKLKKAGIPTAIYYPKPLHIQQAFAGLGHKRDDFPISMDFSRRIFSIPMHPYLKTEDQEKIVKIITN